MYSLSLGPRNSNKCHKWMNDYKILKPELQEAKLHRCRANLQMTENSPCLQYELFPSSPFFTPVPTVTSGSQSSSFKPPLIKTASCLQYSLLVMRTRAFSFSKLSSRHHLSQQTLPVPSSWVVFIISWTYFLVDFILPLFMPMVCGVMSSLLQFQSIFLSLLCPLLKRADGCMVFQHPWILLPRFLIHLW